MRDTDKLREILGPALAGYLEGRPRDMPPGAGDPNAEAFARYRLVPKLLTGAGAPDLSGAFCGFASKAPIIVGAFAGDRILVEGGLLPIARVAAELGLPMVISEECLTPLDEITRLHSGALLQIIGAGPVERAQALAEKAAQAGAIGLVVTALAPVHPKPGFFPGGFDIKAETARRGLSPIGHAAGLAPPAPFPGWGWDELAGLVRHAGGLGLRVVLKGVMRPEDAAKAAEAGCAGIMVSNIGVRNLYRWAPAIGQLPAAAGAARGAAVALDGGVRNGGDVVVSLALGAQFATLVRPVVGALITGGEAGVRQLLGQLIDDTYTIMSWMGAARPADLDATQVISLN